MKNYVETCTSCILKDAQIEMLRLEMGEYKAKYKEAIERANKYTKDDPEYNPT